MRLLTEGRESDCHFRATISRKRLIRKTCTTSENSDPDTDVAKNGTAGEYPGLASPRAGLIFSSKAGQTVRKRRKISPTADSCGSTKYRTKTMPCERMNDHRQLRLIMPATNPVRW